MKTIRNRNGAALLMALLGIVILSSLAILMTKRATVGIRDTAHFRNIQSAFTAAEAGVERARVMLSAGAANTWDDELLASIGADGVVDPTDVPLIAETQINPRQSYRVTIVDNDDFDPSLLIDADNMILVTSIGTSGTVTRTVQALVRNNIRQEHVQEGYGSDNSGDSDNITY